MTNEASMSSEKSRKAVRRIGTVKSDKMDKSIVVRVDRKVLHPVYKKYIKRHTTLVAHDESNQAKVGDTVEVVFGRPMSKTKRWRLERIVSVAVKSAGGAPATGGDA